MNIFIGDVHDLHRAACYPLDGGHALGQEGVFYGARIRGPAT